MRKVITILLLFVSVVCYSQVPKSFKNNKITTDTLILKKLKISTSDTMLTISGDSVRYRIYSSSGGGISGDSLFFYNGIWYNKYDTLTVDIKTDSLFFYNNIWYDKYDTLLIKITSIDSLLKINGTWYNRFDSLTISASADSSIFATKSYTLNNFKGRADSLLSGGFLTRHQAALSYAPITTTNYFSKTGKNIYPLLATDKLMIGSVTAGDTLANTGLNVTNGCVVFKGTTGATPISGAGTRFMWIPAKGSLVAGKATGNYFDDANIGTNCFNFSVDGIVKGTENAAIGGESHNITAGYYGFNGGGIANAISSTGSGHCILGGSTNSITGTANYSGVIGSRLTALSSSYGVVVSGYTCNNTTDFSLKGGIFNIAVGSQTAAYPRHNFEMMAFGNGTNTGASSNNAFSWRYSGMLALNCTDTNSYARSFFQANSKSKFFTSRNMLNLIDNNKNQKINTYAQATDTSSINAVFTVTGKPILSMVGNDGMTKFQVDSMGEVTHRLSHTFLSSEDTTYTPALTQNVYTKIIFGGKEFDNSTLTRDSIRIDKAGSYYFLITISLAGGSGDDFKAALFVGSTKVKSVSQTTTGTSNFQQITIQYYGDGLASGTYVSLRMTNITNNDDPSIKGGTIWFERKY